MARAEAIRHGARGKGEVDRARAVAGNSPQLIQQVCRWCGLANHNRAVCLAGSDPLGTVDIDADKNMAASAGKHGKLSIDTARALAENARVGKPVRCPDVGVGRRENRGKTSYEPPRIDPGTTRGANEVNGFRRTWTRGGASAASSFARAQREVDQERQRPLAELDAGAALDGHPFFRPLGVQDQLQIVLNRRIRCPQVHRGNNQALGLLQLATPHLDCTQHVQGVVGVGGFAQHRSVGLGGLVKSFHQLVLESARHERPALIALDFAQAGPFGARCPVSRRHLLRYRVDLWRRS